MQLIGRFTSPYVRRVGATLNLYGLPYENVALSFREQPIEVARFNPLVRVPALVLDSGEILVDSSAILDHLDQIVGPGRALTPATGAERRAVQHCLALSIGVCEKAITAMIEKVRRPVDKFWQDAFAKSIRQARSGLSALEALAVKEWLSCGRMTQADVTTAVVLDYIDRAIPEVLTDGYPHLAALRERANANPAIGITRPHVH
jgi:glutathione S-transferase